MIPGGKNIACMVIAERGSLRRQGGDGGDTPEVSVGVSQWSRWGKGVSPAEGTTGAEAHRGDSAVRANSVPALCWVPRDTETKETKVNPATPSLAPLNVGPCDFGAEPSLVPAFTSAMLC